MFLTGSKDGAVHVWSTQEVERDATAHSRFSIETRRKVNQICALQNSDYFCVAGADSKVEIFGLNHGGYAGGNRNVGVSGANLPTHDSLVQTLEHPGEGDIVTCLNTVLPISHQHMVTYSSQRGSLFMHDLRCRAPALSQKDAFAMQRGMITSMVLGQDPYQLLCGTIGGYVCVYDIRFSMVSTSYKHSQRYPINSL